jgi:hypothetical protein
MGRHLFQDRRGGSDRRTGRERRCNLGDASLMGVERRSHMDRRSGEERRKWFRLFMKLGCGPLYPLSAREKILVKHSILR